MSALGERVLCRYGLHWWVVKRCFLGGYDDQCRRCGRWRVVGWRS